MKIKSAQSLRGVATNEPELFERLLTAFPEAFARVAKKIIIAEKEITYPACDKKSIQSRLTIELCDNIEYWLSGITTDLITGTKRQVLTTLRNKEYRIGWMFGDGRNQEFTNGGIKSHADTIIKEIEATEENALIRIYWENDEGKVTYY